MILKELRHPSVVPIYAAGALWLICCLFLPMYRLWHYLIYGALTVGGYFLTKHFFPGTVEQVALPQAPPDSGDPEVDALIEKGRGQLERLRALGAEVESPDLRRRAQSLEALGGRIFQALEEDATRLGRTRRFLSYYLPTTVSLLERYRALERQQTPGEHITSTMESIQKMLDKVELAFRRQLDNLYENEAMDVTADIQVLQRMLETEGLLDEEQKPDIL